MKAHTVLSFVALLALPLACSSSTATNDAGTTAPQCNDDPFACSAGQTCWATDTTPNFACLNSGAGQRGQECQNVIGSPSCADGLLCLQTQAGKPGICSAYCDNNVVARACKSGETCTKATLGGGKFFNVCVGPAAVDAGADAAAVDAGSDGAPDANSASDATAD